jgi:bifunctional DNase/RNase
MVESNKIEMVYHFIGVAPRGLAMVLKAKDSERYISFGMTEYEGRAIAGIKEGDEHISLCLHGTIHRFMTDNGFKISCVDIVQREGGSIDGVVTYSTPDLDEGKISMRGSDAVVLALYDNKPIFMEEELVDRVKLDGESVVNMGKDIMGATLYSQRASEEMGRTISPENVMLAHYASKSNILAEILGE